MLTHWRRNPLELQFAEQGDNLSPRDEDHSPVGSEHTQQQPRLAAPINHEHLAKYTLGDRDLEREILQLFVDQLPTLMDQLQAAAGEDDWYMAAHSLKGSARAVGADELGDLAAQAEDYASNREKFDFDALRGPVKRLIPYIEQVA